MRVMQSVWAGETGESLIGKGIAQMEDGCEINGSRFLACEFTGHRETQIYVFGWKSVILCSINPDSQYNLHLSGVTIKR